VFDPILYGIFNEYFISTHGARGVFDPILYGIFNDRPIMYFETYLASEGFVAFQARKEAEGMRLNFRNGMFFEFVPFNEQNFDENGNIKSNAVALNIGQVELNKNYAILLTTCSGAWRYLIGDTIKFVNLDLCEIKITGRTKHFLSLVGEHLSVDNMNKAIQLVSDELNIAADMIEALYISNMLGQEIIRFENVNTNFKTVSTAQLAPGIYSISVVNNGKVSVKQFVKK
jgi:hypothetical protein